MREYTCGSAGTEWQDSPGIGNTEQMEGWKKIVDAVHEGWRIFCQIMHSDRACISSRRATTQIASGEVRKTHQTVESYLLRFPACVGPIGRPCRRGKFRFIPGVPGYAMPTEIPDPWKMVELFRIAALHAKEAGFDGVEGVLDLRLSTMNPGRRSSLRTQCTVRAGIYHPIPGSQRQQTHGRVGRQPRNRARSLLEILKAVRKIWGPNVGFKINPAGGYTDVGFPLEETITSFGYLLSEVDKLGLAYVCILRYLDLFDPAKRGTPHDVWEIYAPYLKNTPLIPNGGITPEQALEWVESGKFPAVSIGIPWMSHPDLGRRIRAGKPLDNKLDGPHVYGGAFEPSIGYLDYPRQHTID
ncbi:unnamed protein product [Mycena citricolor]|uniref:NADH:flavin oxidoreductase/NADH oxidase N-terminal domain-containing protein n=1 Tax=Mycena citricolor TaxID=2018698 RepID=A0AAD2HYQ3_9AGAR|nr:unnamed protein product [Mycena citricolor]